MAQSFSTREPLMAGLFPRKVSKEIAMAEGDEPVKSKKPKAKRHGLMQMMKMLQKTK